MGILGDLFKLQEVQELAARDVRRWSILTLLAQRFSPISSPIINGVYSIDDDEVLEQLLLDVIAINNLDEFQAKLNPFLNSYPNPNPEPPVIKITQDRYQYQLYSLDSQQSSLLNQQSFCLKDDAFHLWDIDKYLQSQKKRLNLAQLFVTLQEITSKNCQIFDDYKGSFSFPFSLTINYQEKRLTNYLLILSDWRGDLEFRLKRLIAENEAEQYSGMERLYVREPFPSEFSRTEINHFIRCLSSYLVGYFQAIKDSFHADFWKHIDSNFILYGYSNGEYWEKHYEDYDEYHQELEQLKLTRSRN